MMEDLPVEALLLIVAHVHYCDVGALALTCKRMYDLIFPRSLGVRIDSYGLSTCLIVPSVDVVRVVPAVSALDLPMPWVSNHELDDKIVLEYRRFLRVHQLHPPSVEKFSQRHYPPGKALDRVWRLHLQYLREYVRDSIMMFGRFFHRSTVSHSALLVKAFIDSYTDVFQTKPPHLAVPQILRRCLC